MPKRKKYPRLPNSYGSIRYLGSGRRNPYAVHPPSKLADDLGDYERPKAICYVDDWYVGFAVLNAYHAGTYQAGDELKFKQYKPLDDRELNDFCTRILSDYVAHSHTENVRAEKEKSFAQVYELWYEWKYGQNAKKKLSKQSQDSTRAAFKNCSALHDKIFRDLRHKDLQDCIDACPLKSASIENMISLIKQMYKYAALYELADQNYSTALSFPENDDEHGTPFYDDDLKILWKHKDDPTVEFILIMCYSGFRISAYKKMEVNTTDWYFKGGVKTAAGKDRTVPIHTSIRPLVQKRLKRDGSIFSISIRKFRENMYNSLDLLKIQKHTPHDCRHTFSRLCEKYGVTENDRKRMMGHSFGADITNGIYGHRTLEELREEIEKIKV